MDDTQHLRRGHLALFNPNPRWPAGYLQVAIESFLHALANDPAVAVAEIDRLLGGAVRPRMEYVEDIPRTPSGKHPYVVRRF